MILGNCYGQLKNKSIFMGGAYQWWMKILPFSIEIASFQIDSNLRNLYTLALFNSYPITKSQFELVQIGSITIWLLLTYKIRC